MVVGRNSTNFHKRYGLSGESTNGAQNAWNMGSPVTLPGIGIIFTPEYINREDYEVLSDVPNSLPSSSGLPDMFIVPQALGPISGTAWGLRVGYDCSIAKDVSELTIIGHYTGRTSGDPSGRFAKSFMKSAVTNVWSYSEMGTTLNTTEPELPHTPHSVGQELLRSIDSRADVLEWVVWQVRTGADYVEVDNFNNSVGATVQGLGSPFMRADNGSWVANETFFKENDYRQRDSVMDKVWSRLLGSTGNPFQPGEKNTVEVAEAIGVRCIVRSKLGSAVIDARTSSFAHFNAEEPTPYNDPEVNAESPTPPLGGLARSIPGQASLEKILTSINVRAMSSESNSIQASKFVSSRDLQKSAYLAHGQEVLGHMYDNHYGFESSWPAPNLTSSRKGKILTKGELPPLVALIPLGVWALGSFLLGISYGFRRRLADSLSGFSFFRFGVYSADKLKDTGIFVAKEAEDVAKLWRLPGSNPSNVSLSPSSYHASPHGLSSRSSRLKTYSSADEAFLVLMANRDFFFFYAPTWDYPPGGAIRLGNVITSVKKPHRPLFCVPPPGDSDVSTTEKKSVQYTKEKLRSGRFSILTKFLSILGLGVDIGAEIDNSDEERFIFKTLETTQFTPSAQYVQKSIESDNVRRFLQNARYRKPVYIITGVKIVRGAEANTSRSRGLGGTFAVEVDGTLLSGGAVPIGGGPGTEGRVGNKTATSWEGSSDFVFAFRVSKVFVGEKTGQVTSEEEYRKGAMLGDETEETRRPMLSVLKIEDPTAEQEGFGSQQLMDDEEVVFCAIPEEEDSDN
ncbi:hypothetical protein CkaCkLH20_07379 [Colletotrichum karsti]|uniref:Uncharacterized protein n=1 Tax=Colletotrichum karsti TaxID=1095194 RepID=A0A9P6LIX8_9PEZI|nr:uncharacterized protein CkaCkLH20_07379 [Colletotrichum karsti]KAF9875113.1 hypothetical protein CkaCkLH20_07379 [Colletotrichum karsti]